MPNVHFRAPRNLPTFDTLLHAIGSPSPKQLGKLLDVHERTVYQWQAKGHAPRAAMLSLFWESHYGRQLMHADLAYEATLNAQLARALQSECKALRGGALTVVGLQAHAANAHGFHGAAKLFKA